MIWFCLFVFNWCSQQRVCTYTGATSYSAIIMSLFADQSRLRSKDSKRNGVDARSQRYVWIEVSSSKSRSQFVPSMISNFTSNKDTFCVYQNPWRFARLSWSFNDCAVVLLIEAPLRSARSGVRVLVTPRVPRYLICTVHFVIFPTNADTKHYKPND